MRQNLNEIKSVLENHNYTMETIIIDLVKKFKLKSIISNTKADKEQGYSVSEIMILLLMIPLMVLQTVNGFFKSNFNNLTEMKKDSIYRFKNNEKVAWRSILYGISKKFQELTKKNTEDKSLVTAFIVDDTFIGKTGKLIENISYVHDHSTGKSGSKLGFKNLFLCYFDGKSISPIDFTIQKEKELSKNKRKFQFIKELSKKSNGFKRRQEAKIDKITNSLSMIKRAVKNGFLAKYVLADAWFPSHRFIKEIREIKNGAMHVVAAIKRDSRKYLFQEKDMNIKEIITKLKAEGKEKRNKKWNVRYYEVTVNYGEIGDVNLYISRFPYQKEWRVFISTDTSLNFNKMLETYSIRWTIEVMFKELKQHLNLGKCQSRDFDAHIAQITISCILYMFLSYLKWKDDYQTIGGIFEYLNIDITEKTIAQRIWLIFEDLLSAVINAISKTGLLDISKFKETAEYNFLKELFESSLLSYQLKNIT